ncbi:MAG: NTE family protein [Bacteroidetes bacterium]|nr:MAG: NTE family protein [Bacteroidota bacterium]
MKIGLVLSGGSARGIIHLGVIKALGEIGIRPGAVSGVSAGSIIGALHLAGFSPEESMRFIVENKFYTWTKMLWGKAGLLDMGKVGKLLSRYLPEKFEDLGGELHVSATDVVSGETIWFNSGELIKPICGSSAIPVVFNPVAIGNYQLLDGGILNNFATEPLEKTCDRIIGVHVNHMGADSDGSIGMRDVIDRVAHLAISDAVRSKKNRCHVFIEPQGMNRFNPMSLGKAQEMFDVGYAHTMQMRAELEKLMQ